MKTKTFDKRLVLSKKTITNLDNKEMKSLHGGVGNTQLTICTPRTCYC